MSGALGAVDEGAACADAPQQAPSALPADVHAQLDGYLAAVARDDAYEVVEVLGSKGEERPGATELVTFPGPGGTALGPFVRKRIDLATKLGGAYEELFGLQREGMRFKHLPRIIDCYKTAAQLVVLLEYVPGETLAAQVKRLGPSVELACAVFPGLCDAVEELHGAACPAIIHRDLKPQNVIVAPRGVFLIDLGIARRYREQADTDTVRFGTRPYAPPEQYGFGQTDVRSDVYALGVILWFCLTGKDPKAHLDGQVLEEAGQPAPFAEVIRRATAIDPAHRFTSACELGDAFSRACALLDAAAGAGVSASGGSEHAGAPVAAGTTPSGDAAVSVAPAPCPPSPAAVPSHDDPTRREHRPARIKNVLLALVAVLFAAGVVNAVIHPAGVNVGKPTWYLASLAVFTVAPLFLGPLYLVCDKRALYRRVPALARRTWKQDLRLWGIMLLVGFCIMLVLTLIVGL